jgi:integrase/recombinase XerD
MTRRPPIADWPARDRELWNKAVEPGGLFGGGGAGAHWSAESRVMVARGYNAWLSWLAAKELLDPNMRPAVRVTCERVGAYIAEIQAELAPYSVLGHVQGLHDALRVMEPESNWKWLARLRLSLRAQVRPARDKLSCLKPPQELIALGERLMDEAEAAAEWSARRRAVRYRDGLLIALLAFRPVRRKNLAMMRLGRHLMKVGGCWQIVFAAEETKTRVPYEAVLPAALGPRLERYLGVHRPVLLRGRLAASNPDAPPIDPELDAVWVSEVGTQLSYQALGLQIFFRTRREFGRGLFPHMFRDCVATAVAVDNPKHIGDASLILGHAGHRTTEKHYNHARSLDASRRHAAMLASLRESLKANGNR